VAVVDVDKDEIVKTIEFPSETGESMWLFRADSSQSFRRNTQNTIESLKTFRCSRWCTVLRLIQQHIVFMRPSNRKMAGPLHA